MLASVGISERETSSSTVLSNPNSDKTLLFSITSHMLPKPNRPSSYSVLCAPLVLSKISQLLGKVLVRTSVRDEDTKETSSSSLPWIEED